MREQLTEHDVKKIEEEIEYRKLVVRKEAIEAVKEARAHGDLSENFEYHAAKKDKNRNESRIRYLERMLKTAKIVKDTSAADEAGLNNLVEVYFPEDDETDTFKLVTSIRGNSLDGKISIESPLGKAILKKHVGDRVKVHVNDDYSYEVEIRSIQKTTDDTDDKIRSYKTWYFCIKQKKAQILERKKGVRYMSGNTELLNFVYQNSQMGMESLSQLLEIAEDEEFRSCMEKQLDKYREFHNEAKRLLQERGHNEKSLGMFDKLKTYLMINMQTMSDKSTSHLAQMLIEGSSMGVTNALQDLRKYEDADTEILRLMRKLYKFEEKNVETYKAFL